ncbi:DEMETER-like protein 3 [Cardamine amara subsp. amara]|uniref:DEMETER-like protein 3 n=1 Tax=Cardamine amara subsp. amara TaxID=228776 RepID=A0ABD1BG35_CARAN
MQETTMGYSQDSDTPPFIAVPWTPTKPRQSLKFYVRRRVTKVLNKAQDIHDSAIFLQDIKDPVLLKSNTSLDAKTNTSEVEIEEKTCFPGDCGFVIMKKIEESETLQGAKNSKSNITNGIPKEKKNISKHEEKCDDSEIPQDDAQHVNGKGKRKNTNGTLKKSRFHRPRIMEEGKKQRNPATIRLRTVSKKRKKNDKDGDDEILVEPETPDKKSFPKRRKNEKTKRNVARTLIFDDEIVLSCLELSRMSGPNFPNKRKRMTTFRRSDFHSLISAISFPMPVWKKLSKRSKRRKNMDRWARIAVCLKTKDTSKRVSKCKKGTKKIVKPLTKQMNYKKDNEFSFIANASLETEDTVLAIANGVVSKRHDVVSKRRNKKSKDIDDHLMQQMNYQKEHGLSSLADVPFHIEETLMGSASNEPSEPPVKRTKDIGKLIKEMKRLKIKKRTTTLIKSKKKLVTAKVNLDPETIKEWELLMVNDFPDDDDKETRSKWKEERETFKSRIDLFINRMHLLQGDRKFKQWKGSVVDSVVGVFLTQNVSDYLSSNAFMSVVAKFPAEAKECFEGLAYYVEEPPEVNDSKSTHIGNNDAKSAQLITLPEDSIPKVEEHEKTAKRKNEKTGILEDETVDWNALRRMYTKEGSRDLIHMDSVNWNDVRLSGQQVLADTIIKRGQFRILSGRILKFLNDEVKQNGIADLEWLRDAPSDLVKRYLLEIEGLGLKSVECVRLLGLKHSAFPVDTNVGRIAVRLGWVPLEPLPNGVQMHQLFQYPSMDSIQKYLWPRLCKLPQETLYELHYQMITFGKVFCTKVIPNCNACPMKSECKYFASAYVSSKVLLEGPEKKPHESDTFMHTDSQNVDADMLSSINLIEECASLGCSDQAIDCEPMVEFPCSPIAEIPDIIDIEDTPCGSLYQSYDRIPEIDIDMEALKKTVKDALLKDGKMLSSSDEEISKALVVLTRENACIPIKPPKKMKYYNRLRTEHVVYVLPDDHELLNEFERRESDDPSPYLLAIWQPGEMSYSFTPPKKKCNSNGSVLCKFKTCSYCWNIREQSSNTFRGTILIPCRTAMRGCFPLNGTYFQTNEVFADYETSLRPVVFPREWCDGLEKRALYCGSSVTSIFRFLDTRRIQLCFWTGFLCMRAFDRKQRNPKGLVRRLHTPPDERGEKHMKDDDI